MWILELLMYLAYVAAPAPWLIALADTEKLHKGWKGRGSLFFLSLVACYTLAIIGKMIRGSLWAQFATMPILAYFAEDIANALTLLVGLVYWLIMFQNWRVSKKNILRRQQHMELERFQQESQKTVETLLLRASVKEGGGPVWSDEVDEEDVDARPDQP